MKIDLYCQRCIDYVDILLGVPPLGVYNRNTVSENGTHCCRALTLALARLSCFTCDNSVLFYNHLENVLQMFCKCFILHITTV